MKPRLSPGRLLYLLYHRPLGAVITSIHAGGPIEQARTARGRMQMRRAAAVLPPLPAPPAGAPEIQLLSGKGLWYQTAFFVRSLFPVLPFVPVIHEDGTLGPADRGRLARLAPFARFVSTEEVRERLDRVLPASRFPFLRAGRDENVLFRKLLDIHAGRTGWRLFCDSDMLVFRRPEALAAWFAQPEGAIHMADVKRSYGYDIEILHELAGGPVTDRINTGILGLPSDRIDWDRMEFWTRTLVERAGTSYFIEQALVALLLAGMPHAVLPASDYVVLPNDAESTACRAIIHHYVAESKRGYFRANWRRFAAGAPGAA